jgi:hypothetical protein
MSPLPTTVTCPNCGETSDIRTPGLKFPVTVRGGKPLGFYFGKYNVLVSRSAGWISLDFDGVECRVTVNRRTFWTSCPHVQDESTEAWLRRHGLRPRDTVELVYLGGDKYRVLPPG